MSTLYIKIKEEKIAAMKAGDSVKNRILSTILGEAELKAKMKSNRVHQYPDDAEVISVIDVNLKSAKENKNLYGKDTDYEISLLESFKPSQLTENELFNEISVIVAQLETVAPVQMKDMKMILSELKELHGGKYSPQAASNIIREMIIGNSK